MLNFCKIFQHIQRSYWYFGCRLFRFQGRTSWWNPGVASDPEQQENEGEEEEIEEPEQAEPEVGPPLLTPLSEDAEVGNTSPWTVKLSSKMLPQYAVAVVSSCLWPGAYAFGSGR